MHLGLLSLCLLEKVWLLFDVVLLVPLPPGPLQVLNTLLIWGRHLQVPFFQMPVWTKWPLSVNTYSVRWCQVIIKQQLTYKTEIITFIVQNILICTWIKTKLPADELMLQSSSPLFFHLIVAISLSAGYVFVGGDVMLYLWSGLNRASVRGRTSFSSGQSSFSSMANLVKP